MLDCACVRFPWCCEIWGVEFDVVGMNTECSLCGCVVRSEEGNGDAPGDEVGMYR